MLKLLHVAAVLGLLGAAGWAYSIKYETLYYTEQVRKLEKQLARERDTIGVLEAEWQHMNNPVRLQHLADKHLSMQPMQATQIIRPPELPLRQPKNDLIGQKLDALITGSVPTPDQSRRSNGRTPGGQ